MVLICRSNGEGRNDNLELLDLLSNLRRKKIGKCFSSSVLPVRAEMVVGT